MLHAQALNVARIALDLQRTHPHVPAIDVLDLAMQGLHYGTLDFTDPTTPGGDHTDPLSPFGALLGKAFAPHLDADYCAAFALDIDEAWHFQVLEPFWERYGLG